MSWFGLFLDSFIPGSGLYDLGGVINSATGGVTAAPTLGDALFIHPGSAGDNRFSTATQALSGYHDPSGVPGQGEWRTPVLNQDSLPALWDLLKPLALPVGLGLGAYVLLTRGD